MDCTSGFWCFQLKDLINVLILIATIAAIYLGPVHAVEISRRNDERRETRRRQYAIFHDLMKTRRIALAAEHVMALNLIVIEFYEHQKINDAFKRYVEHLGLQLREGDDLTVLSKERDDRFFDLVHEIGAHLGFNLDKRDLEKFSYVPRGWGDLELAQANLRRLSVEVLSGRRPLPVTQFRASDAVNKFPPSPQ